jgi:hypothetical protein
MRPAFPASDYYYGGSVPSPGHQLTANLPVATLAGRRRGQPEDGSHVHHAPVGRIGAQLFPCSIATPTPQTFNVASRSVSIPGLGVASRFVSLGVHCHPARIHQIGAGSTLKGVQTLVHSRYTYLPR